MPPRFWARACLLPISGADYLIYVNPQQKVFVDGRSDFYGPEIGNQYIHLVNGQWDWQQVMDEIPTSTWRCCPWKWPLSSCLKLQPDWRVVDDDGKRILLVRRLTLSTAYGEFQPGTKVLRNTGVGAHEANENHRPGRNSNWEQTRMKSAEREPARKGRWPAQFAHADSADPHGVDGSDELAVAIGEGAGGVCVASGIFGAVDAWDAGFQEAEEDVAAPPVDAGVLAGTKKQVGEAPEHSGTFREDGKMMTRKCGSRFWWDWRRRWMIWRGARSPTGFRRRRWPAASAGRSGSTAGGAGCTRWEARRRGSAFS